MKLQVEFELEEDGRWIADVMELPGVMAYGRNRDEALAAAKALALRVVRRRPPGVEPDTRRSRECGTDRGH